MPPKTASPGLGGEISALLALPNAMTNDASLAATHSATSFGSLLLHPQCAVPQAEIHLKRLATRSVFLLKLGCSAEINLDFSNIMAVLVCVGFGAFRQLQVGSNNPQHQMRNSGGIITKYKQPRTVLMKRYIKKEIASFFIMLGSPMISPSSFHLCPVQANSDSMAHPPQQQSPLLALSDGHIHPWSHQTFRGI